MTPSKLSAMRLLITLTAAIFVAELVIMFGLQFFAFHNTFIEALIDAAALTIVTFPVLYFWVFRSLMNKNAELVEIEEHLRASQKNLEIKVDERNKNLTETNKSLESSVQLLAEQQQEMAILGEMGQMFQACPSLEEAYEIVVHHLQRLFPDVPGALYMFRSSRNLLERVSAWNEREGFDDSFMPDECWALRRGRLHESGGGFQINCKHNCAAISKRDICLPMTAGGEILGILSLRFEEEQSESTVSESDKHTQFLTTVAESLALGIANIRLRETLRQQALRDKLTGLYNRRFVDEAIELELHRAARTSTPFSIIMFDVDHFKRFNDTHGHDAGDSVLSQLGRVLLSSARKSDIPCRFGGEEFLFLLSGIDMEDAFIWAQQLCSSIADQDFRHEGQPLGQVTISCGVATFPEQAVTKEELIQLADKALYVSKRNGRNQVTKAELLAPIKADLDIAL